MKILAFLLPLLSLLAACTKPHVTQPQGIRHVVVIGVDGLSPDGIRKAKTPNLDFLMKEGAFSLHARSVTPSSSSSNWASMIMGADVEQHGVHSNSYKRDDFILPPVVKGTEDIFPTIFGEVNKQLPGAEIGAIYHWRDFGRLFEKSAVDYDVHDSTEAGTALLAASYIREKQPAYCFVHLDHVDHAGHEFGHGSPEYYASVERADSLIGQILEAVKSTDMAGSTMVLICADHGGINKGHGGYTLAEMEIPFILWGKGIKKGYEIPVPVYQYDNAATTAFALNLVRPYAWIGRPVSCAFEGFEVPAANYPVEDYTK
ncbi:MAG: alkaline phosphatase [Bacteroidia bacterium]